MVRIWCEFDIGQENMVFRTEARAQKWLEENLVLKDHEADSGETLKELQDGGLVGFKPVEEIGE